jgi:hypothetical protein
LAITAVLVAASVAHAQSAPPPGATGLCKDGTYATATTKSGACHGHQGVKEWFVTDYSANAPATSATGSTQNKAGHASTATITQAPGGGDPGMVWLNSDTNVYHCPGTQYYGKTKQGSYISEADAKAKGAHPTHNHPCTK